MTKRPFFVFSSLNASEILSKFWELVHLLAGWRYNWCYDCCIQDELRHVFSWGRDSIRQNSVMVRNRRKSRFTIYISSFRTCTPKRVWQPRWGELREVVFWLVQLIFKIIEYSYPQCQDHKVTKISDIDEGLMIAKIDLSWGGIGQALMRPPVVVAPKVALKTSF